MLFTSYHHAASGLARSVARYVVERGTFDELERLGVPLLAIIAVGAVVYFAVSRRRRVR
jgi:hypothetical protein